MGDLRKCGKSRSGHTLIVYDYYITLSRGNIVPRQIVGDADAGRAATSSPTKFFLRRFPIRCVDFTGICRAGQQDGIVRRETQRGREGPQSSGIGQRGSLMRSQIHDVNMHSRYVLLPARGEVECFSMYPACGN